MPRIGRRLRPGMRGSLRYQMESSDFPVPVLYLKFGENAGDVAYDSSPEGNDGDIDGATWTTGYLGPGLDFDGLDDEVVVGSDGSIDDLTAFTYVARIKMESIGTSMILTKNGNKNWFFLRDPPDSNLRLQRRTDGTHADSRATEKIVVDTWYHVVATYDDDGDRKARLYINGIEVVYLLQQAATGTLASDAGKDLLVGSRHPPYIEAVIDEVRVYDVALTALQVQELHDGIW